MVLGLDVLHKVECTGYALGFMSLDKEVSLPTRGEGAMASSSPSGSHTACSAPRGPPVTSDGLGSAVRERDSRPNAPPSGLCRGPPETRAEWLREAGTVSPVDLPPCPHPLERGTSLQSQRTGPGMGCCGTGSWLLERCLSLCRLDTKLDSSGYLDFRCQASDLIPKDPCCGVSVMSPCTSQRTWTSHVGPSSRESFSQSPSLRTGKGCTMPTPSSRGPRC